MRRHWPRVAASTPSTTLLDLRAQSEALVAAQRERILASLGIAALLLLVTSLRSRCARRVARTARARAHGADDGGGRRRAASRRGRAEFVPPDLAGAGSGARASITRCSSSTPPRIRPSSGARCTPCSSARCRPGLVFALLAASGLPVLRAIGVPVAIGVASQFRACAAAHAARRRAERIDDLTRLAPATQPARCSMDPVSHGVVGASWAFAAARRSRLLMSGAVAGLAALAPDLDLLIRSSGDPLLTLQAHRTFTHSLAVSFAAALVLALVLYPWARRQLSFWRDVRSVRAGRGEPLFARCLHGVRHATPVAVLDYARGAQHHLGFRSAVHAADHRARGARGPAPARALCLLGDRLGGRLPRAGCHAAWPRDRRRCARGRGARPRARSARGGADVLATCCCGKSSTNTPAATTWTGCGPALPRRCTPARASRGSKT